MTSTAPSEMLTAVEPAIVDGAKARGRRRRRPIGLVLAVGWLGLVVLLAVLADVLPLADPDVDVGKGTFVDPFTDAKEIFGTDDLGRSMLSRLIYGARVSLMTGVVSVVIGMGAGLLIGVASGYFRGTVDTVLGVLLDTILAFPALVLLLALAAVLQPGVSTVILGLSIIATPLFARVARVKALQTANQEYVLAARGSGATTRTILFREILPNVAESLLALAGVVSAALILAEAGLSFLGLGVRPPTPSWGNMVENGRQLLQYEPQVVFVPGIVLFLTIYSLNVIGEHLRARSDAGSKL